MQNLKSISTSNDSRETIEEFLKIADNIDCLIIVALDKEGKQILRTSTVSAYKKSFLILFLNAWMTSWFNIQSEDS